MNLDFKNVKPGKQRLAIFASGAGSNAENCIRYFAHHELIEIAIIITNRKNAGVIDIANAHSIRCEVIDIKHSTYINNLINLLQETMVDYILLAGYLALIPPSFIAAYRHKIINIHPALLPKYGGKGMYGSNVHQAVYANGETETGITIHEVDEIYDRGKILFQKIITLQEPITPMSIEQQVRQLEYQYLPIIVEKLLLNN